MREICNLGLEVLDSIISIFSIHFMICNYFLTVIYNIYTTNMEFGFEFIRRVILRDLFYKLPLFVGILQYQILYFIEAK